MSRVAKNPIAVPSGVEITIDEAKIVVKGPKGTLEQNLHQDVTVGREEGQLQVAPRDGDTSKYAIAGTMRALLQNMIIGASKGFERKLELVGVGYRAQAQGAKLNLSLGFSHPIEYAVPEGIAVETPTQTEIWVRGTDKQRVGQVAAEIRAFRPPEPYKGKGVKYANEKIVRKEAKKK